jgi:hypothetical protein
LQPRLFFAAPTEESYLAASNFPQLRGHCLANYVTDPVFRALLGFFCRFALVWFRASRGYL